MAKKPLIMDKVEIEKVIINYRLAPDYEVRRSVEILRSAPAFGLIKDYQSAKDHIVKALNLPYSKVTIISIEWIMSND